MSSTVIVTGGAGFIGCAIAPALATTFDEVVAVDNLHPQIHASGARPEGLDPRVRLVEADVTEPGTWDELLVDLNPEVVVHLAAETGTGQSLAESTRHAHVNVVGTTQLLDGLRRHARLPRRVVLSSSRAIYGEGGWRDASGAIIHPPQRTASSLEDGKWDFDGAQPIPMDARVVAPAPVSVYAATKLAQEHILRVWANSYGVQPAILRLQNVYGPGQSLSNPYTGILSLFARMARSGASIPLYEDGLVRRDFVFIDDVASAIVAATVSDQVSRDALDIGCGTFETIRTAAELIATYYGAPKPHITGKFREGDVRHAWADTAHAEEVLGWRPRYGLAEGVQRLCDWIEAQDDVPPA